MDVNVVAVRVHDWDRNGYTMEQEQERTDDEMAVECRGNDRVECNHGQSHGPRIERASETESFLEESEVAEFWRSNGGRDAGRGNSERKE